MAHLSVNFRSQVLGVMTSMEVILPEVSPASTGSSEPVWDGNEPLPALYLLHGTGDNHTAWCRNTSIERYVENKKLAVIMPAGGRSIYTNQVNGYDYFSFISEELPEVTRRMFRLSRKRENTFIGGLSMGGYGAMRAGLACPEKFGRVICLSGGVDRVSFMLSGYTKEQLADKAFVLSLKDSVPADYWRLHEFANAFGSAENYKNNGSDIYALIDSLAASGKTPPEIYIAIGTEDTHYEPNIRLRQRLEQNAIPFTYEEGPGIHEWAFWDKYIQNAIAWLPL